jgi:hypothetical protein
MNRRFGLLNESLEKLKSENIDKEALQEHIKMIEELKENLMKGLNIPSDRNESMCQVSDSTDLNTPYSFAETSFLSQSSASI